MPKEVLKILAEIDYFNVNECFNFRTTRPSALCPMPGFFIEIINVLTTRLNITVQFTNMDTFLPKPSKDQRASDIVDLVFELLRNGTADLMSIFFDRNPAVYGESFEFTEPIYLGDSKYVVLRAQVLTGIFSFFTVYNFYLWIGIFGIFCLFLLVSYAMNQCASRAAINDRKSIGNIAWQLFRLKLRQYTLVEERLLSLNALVFVFAIFNCGILIQIYNNVITSQVVRQNDPWPFRPTEIFKVLKEKRYSLMFPSRYVYWYQAIQNSSASPYFELREAVKKNPIKLTYEMNLEDPDAYLLNKVNSGKYITVLSKASIVANERKGFCNFVYINMPTPTVFKVLTQYNFPEVNECFNLRNPRPSIACSIPGLFIEVIGLIVKRLNVTAEFVNIQEFKGGRTSSELDQLSFDFVRNGTFDVFSSFFGEKTSEYGKGLKATESIYWSESKYVVAPAERNLDKIFSFFEVYDSYTWMGIFGTFCLFLLAGYLMFRCAPMKVVNNQKSFSKLSWQLFRLQLMQYDSIRERLLSFNALTLVFALFNVGILIQMYNSLVTSQVVQSVDKKPFKGDEIIQLLKEKKYTMIFPERHSAYHHIPTNTTKSPYFELHLAMKDNPIRLAEEMTINEDLNNYTMYRVQQGKR